jgi:hypothetical protein
MQPSTICMFYQWKTGSTNEFLIKYNSDNVAQVDITGTVMMCRNEWHCPNAINKFRTAVRSLHHAYTCLDKPYETVCVQCRLANTELQRDPNRVTGVHGSCEDHPNLPQLRAKGNAANSVEVEMAHNKYLELVAGWQIKGSIQLLPGEVRALRKHLCNTGKIVDFQIYVMIILGIKLFLRADELLEPRICEHGGASSREYDA